MSLSIALALVMGIRIGKPVRYFGEHEFITWISTAQLLVVAGLSYKIFQLGRLNDYAVRDAWRSPGVVWLIVSLGFVYLACDEYFLFHENIDRWIHSLFGIEETGLTDRIDDLLVGLYGIIGILTFYVYREKILKVKPMLPYFALGFTLLFTMVVLDVVSNRSDILSTSMSADRADRVLMVLAVAEESFKVLSEIFFLVAFYGALRLTRGTADTSIKSARI